MNSTILLLVLLGCVALVAFLYFKFFKMFKMKSIVFIDGSLGTGKSFYSVSIAVRLYKRQLRRYKVKKWLFKLLAPTFPKIAKKYKKLEEPLLYSNMPLRRVKYVLLTKDLLYRRNVRFAFHSIILIDEFSILADQFTFKDRELNERLTLFFKLLRHELHAGGSTCVINSQSTSDLHFSLKYVLSDYLYIHHMTKLPFFCLLKVQEMAYSADKDGGNVINVRSSDIEDSLKTLIVWKKYFKYYDSIYLSIFTDKLPPYTKTEYNPSGKYIKKKELVSFKEFPFLYENLEVRKDEKAKS